MGSEEGEKSHCHVPPPLCSQGCGFFGNPSTGNLCSKCYTISLMEKLQITDVSTTPTEPPSLEGPSMGSTGSEEKGTTGPRRCYCCNKKVRLLGFGCRCGRTFCGTHRHPEQHGCSFDYKSSGKESTSKSNPLVKPRKLQTI